MRNAIVTACTLLAMVPQTGAAQISLDSAKVLFGNKQYATVIKPLVQLRATAKGDQQLTLDYMIAASYCRLPNATQRVNGQRAFDAMVRNYARDLSAEHKRHLMDERAKCSNGQSAASMMGARYVALVSRKGDRRATYNFAGGKQFMDVCGASPVGKRGISAENAIEGTRSLRVWPRSQLDSARAAAQTVLRDKLRSSGKVVARDGIVIATLGTQTTAQMDSMLSTIIRYRDFFASEYGLPIPDVVLQVYLAPSHEAMGALANEVHGLPLDNRLIGYSSLSDFSMVGIIPRTIYGTLMHELMHLLFRNHITAAAPWLDEGLAALYEVSTVRGGRVVGLPNWRGQILYRMGGPVYRLSELLGNDWSRFEGGEVSPEYQAMNQAYARYFVLYLQDKGKLADVVRAINSQPVLSYKSSANDLQVETMDGAAMQSLIARTLGVSPAALETDFRGWWERVKQVGWTPCS
jgi:hypothetical protein